MGDHSPNADEADSDLSLTTIVEEAVALLDEQGLEGFTMRKLAQRLGRSTMATYRHVESREALLRLAAEAAQPEPPSPDEAAWPDRLEAVIRHGWTHTWKPHAWIAQLIHTGIVGPSSHRSLPLVRAIYEEAGFAEDELDRALVAHWSFMLGALTVVRRIVESGGPLANSGEAFFEFNLQNYLLGIQAQAPAPDWRNAR